MPMYDLLMDVSSIVDMSAWYTMFLLRQLPSNGHSCGLMQLQFFVLVLFSLVLFAINFLLCFLMILSMFSKQL